MSSRRFAASLNRRKFKEQPTPIILRDIDERGIAEKAMPPNVVLAQAMRRLAYLSAAGASAAGASAAGAAA